MIESLRDIKHKSGSYENLEMERTANKILHRMEDKVNEDSLDGTRARILGVYQSCPKSRLLTSLSERSNDLRSQPMSRRDKFRSNFLAKDRRCHSRTQSDE